MNQSDFRADGAKENVNFKNEPLDEIFVKEEPKSDYLVSNDKNLC